MNPKALILVDIQNDFCPGGALPVAGGDEVVAVANALLPWFDLAVATKDWHPANHRSFASQNPEVTEGEMFELNGLPQVAWPDHCVQATLGADFVPALDHQYVTKIFKKGTDIEIDSYSGFFDNGKQRSTGLNQFLVDQYVKEVYIMGLATDYCVKFTALDAAELGFDTSVVIDGCRGVELCPGDIAAAFDEMETAGVKLVQSNQIIHEYTKNKTNQ